MTQALQEGRAITAGNPGTVPGPKPKVIPCGQGMGSTKIKEKEKCKMATHAVTLKPFLVPNYVGVESGRVGKRQDGFQEEQRFELSELSSDELDTLCAEFRANVFRKANKPDPQKLGQ